MPLKIFFRSKNKLSGFNIIHTEERRGEEMLIFIALFFIVPYTQGIRFVDEDGASVVPSSQPVSSPKSAAAVQKEQPYRSSRHRADPERYWGGDGGCSSSDVVLNQGPTPPLPSGIPTYTVSIINACTSGCDIAGIHLSCGWFSSARLVNPKIFKRLGFDDCLVNDGKPLSSGRAISFQYANTFPYPLSVSSVDCP